MIRSLFTVARSAGPSGSSADYHATTQLLDTKQQITSYKAPSLKASDAEGHVQKFSVPKAPRSPDEGDIAQDLKDYENQQVDLEGLADPDGEPHQDYWTEAEAWLEDDDDAPPRC
ncbi:MAG: hypothetical protein LQ344_002269 [Seirophora lacunosa]|nr:MAG: hypothetical protein LQ344_002269 [Seirophora lacunosa]